MLKFKEYLEESKNTHMDHLEDLIFLRGIDGTRDSILDLIAAKDMLSGKDANRNITTKFDGAPAIFCGINPENGKFFVATKSLFNKTPKINYTPADIDKNHSGEGLNEKLKIALKYLKDLNIRTILQGDMMFTKSDLKKQKIDGVPHITSQPNTIVYAVPDGTPLASKIKAAEMGIVFHTEYRGKSIDSLKASFSPNISKLRKSTKVFYSDASFRLGKDAMLSPGDASKVDDLLSECGRLFRKVDKSVVNRLNSDKELNMFLLTHTNVLVRAGENYIGGKAHVAKLRDYVSERVAKKKDSVKSDAAKSRYEEKMKEYQDFIDSNKSALENIFDLYYKLREAKSIIVRKLQTVKQSAGTYIADEEGIRVTAPEGFVLVSGGDRVVKFVDRFEFSRNNFNDKLKQWSK